MATEIETIIDDFTVEEMRWLANEIHNNLIEVTPVDTGFAVNSWQAGLNEPPTGAYNESTAAATMQAILTAQADDTIFIVNNAEYIEELNDGSSRKAAAGFVEASIDKALRRLDMGRLHG